MADSRAPTGLARRGRRLPEDETERRMLRAALAMVNRTGLTVSLEHISFEDVIRDADVSRSSAYHRWPHKDLFFSDLVLELARNPAPGIVADEMDLIRRIVAGRLDGLADPQARRALVVELFRQLAGAGLRDLVRLAGLAHLPGPARHVPEPDRQRTPRPGPGRARPRRSGTAWPGSPGPGRSWRACSATGCERSPASPSRRSRRWSTPPCGAWS